MKPQSADEKIGGMLHKVLNNTLSRKLTIKEYQTVIEHISSMFDISYRKGIEDALGNCKCSQNKI